MKFSMSFFSGHKDWMLEKSMVENLMEMLQESKDNGVS